ncbi:hypothetical protein MYSTI_07728 [Myxococcus stipitatus DSM 14675]|uniref:Uncharacterized protein n=1 Tax=Myxococcus stipitatus (strain DSM 14675 / JCM 12634 / Mx s8) TaxID=1278073 RepID=L7UM97_MYXSD|nr:hypothetical protein [Myxococcus stipitatus]AGC49000.1 hypothetical protein MYSTI_07728 [Myxococcus stipitatus DSM 14675]
MPTSPSKKMSLLTEPEARLVLSSSPRNVVELSTRDLRGRILRARKLMRKYQDTARRQRREALRKRTPTRSRRAEGNANTVRKALYFQQALSRFEKRLALMERQEARAAALAKRKMAKPRRALRTKRAATGRKPVRRTRTAGKMATASQRSMKAQRRKGGARKQQGFGAVRRTSHVVARNRRTQARKDSRR